MSCMDSMESTISPLPAMPPAGQACSGPPGYDWCSRLVGYPADSLDVLNALRMYRCDGRPGGDVAGTVRPVSFKLFGACHHPAGEHFAQRSYDAHVLVLFHTIVPP